MNRLCLFLALMIIAVHCTPDEAVTETSSNRPWVDLESAPVEEMIRSAEGQEWSVTLIPAEPGSPGPRGLKRVNFADQAGRSFEGRDRLDLIFGDVFVAESAIYRPSSLWIEQWGDLNPSYCHVGYGYRAEILSVEVPEGSVVDAWLEQESVVVRALSLGSSTLTVRGQVGLSRDREDFSAWDPEEEAWCEEVFGDGAKAPLTITLEANVFEPSSLVFEADAARVSLEEGQQDEPSGWHDPRSGLGEVRDDAGRDHACRLHPVCPGGAPCP